MLLSNMDPIFSEWIKLSTPLFSGIVNVLTLGTMFLLMQLTYNALSRLIRHLLAV